MLEKTIDVLSVTVTYSRCLGFTSSALLNPTLQLEAASPEGKYSTSVHVRKQSGVKIYMGPHNFTSNCLISV